MADASSGDVPADVPGIPASVIDTLGDMRAEVEKPKRRIAICGSAPSSIKHAPVGQPEWEIWGCSPGCAQNLDPKKVSRWFEIHHFDTARPDFEADYVRFMANVPGPVYTIKQVPELPNSVAFPFDDLRAKFTTSLVGRSFLASTVSYMLAMAIDENPDEIGFWGIDMAASSEYALQKPGCHYFIQIAESRGIRVTSDPRSDLLQPIPPYGFVESQPMFLKLKARHDELSARISGFDAERTRHINRANELQEQITFFRGALDDLQYVMNTWVQR